MNTLWIGCQLGPSDYSVDVVLAWIWDPMEDERRAVINTERRLCCRGDECAVNTFWQGHHQQIDSASKGDRPVVRMQSLSLCVQLRCWKLRISFRTWLFEVASRRRDRIAGSHPMELMGEGRRGLIARKRLLSSQRDKQQRPTWSRWPTASTRRS